MADLDQVVEFDALMNHGRTHRSAIDTSIGSDLDIVLDPHVADLRNFVEFALFVRGETETVGADHRSGVDRHIVADNAGFVNPDARIQRHVVAEPHPVAEIYLRIYFAILTGLYALFDHRIGADVSPLSDRGGRIDRRQRTDARLLRFVGDIKFEQLRKARIGILYLHHRRRYRSRRLERSVDNHDARLGIVDIVFVLRVRQKSESSGFALLDLGQRGRFPQTAADQDDLGQRGDDGFRIANDFPAEETGDEFRSKFHIFQYFIGSNNYI